MTVNLHYVEKLKKIIIEHKHCWGTIVKHGKENKELFQYILDFTSQHPDLPFATKAYWTLNQLTDFPICRVCGKNHLPPTKKCDPLLGYASDVCSQSCAQKDPRKLEQDKIRNLEKYGVEHVSQRQCIRDKISLTKLKKTDEDKLKIQEKRILTCVEKYGVDNVSKVVEIADRKRETYLSHSIEEQLSIIERTRLTKLKKYGNETFCNPTKISETKLNFSDEKKHQIRVKTEETNVAKYGVKCPLNSKKSIAAAKKTKETQFYSNNILKNVNNVQPLFSLDEFLQHGRNYKYRWKCTQCNEIFEQEVGKLQLYIARCLRCEPHNAPYSKAEKEISEFLSTYVNKSDQILNDRSVIPPKELDIFIPSRKLAIEYDGLYWHSEKQEDPINSQLEKTNACEKQGIQLIHIFENEWLSKNDIVKDRLKHLLGIYNHIVFARKCTIHEVQSDVSNKFQDENHLQGAVNAKVNVGLYFQDELISLMTFSRPRFDKKHEWELVRFCNKLGYHVPGAAGKLLKYFELTYRPTSLVSYADRRWSQGKLYKALGFQLDHISRPNYWYWDHKHNGVLESRIKYQKHKLATLLNSYDANLTEQQNMANNGYLRIFDCGNLVFVKTY